jgi:hypothetical protein
VECEKFRWWAQTDRTRGKGVDDKVQISVWDRRGKEKIKIFRLRLTRPTGREQVGAFEFDIIAKTYGGEIR